jgi:hypothetical protein
MFGQLAELELPEPVEGVVVVVDGVVVVVIAALVPLEDEELPVAACVIAAAPPAIAPVATRVSRTFRNRVCMSLTSFPWCGVEFQSTARACEDAGIDPRAA